MLLHTDETLIENFTMSTNPGRVEGKAGTPIDPHIVNRAFARFSAARRNEPLGCWTA